MKTNSTNIDNLRDSLYKVLRKEVGKKNCCLMDLPNYYNPGDQLIWEGEKTILRNLECKVSYYSSLQFFNPRMIQSGVCILLQGGGNFGDLYPKHQKFREYVVKHFPRNKIVILPTTVYFSNIKNMLRNASVFSHHKDLLICARDTTSLRYLKTYYVSNKSVLLPDTAYAIEDLKQNDLDLTSNKVLFLRRHDKEYIKSHNEKLFNFIKNLDVKDWPSYNKKPVKAIMHLSNIELNKLLHKSFSILGIDWHQKNDVFGILKIKSKESQIQSAYDFISQYSLIITTRLHGHILACLLGVPNILLDNSYGKNKNFYDTWMSKNSMNAYYATNTENVKKIMKAHFQKLLYKP